MLPPLDSIKLESQLTLKRKTTDGFTELHLMLRAGTRFPKAMLRKMDISVSDMSHKLSQSSLRQYIVQLAYEILFNELNAFYEFVANHKAVEHAKSCVQTGGCTKVGLKGYGTIICQHVVSKKYQTDGTPPAHQKFQDDTGRFPNLTKWSPVEVLHTPEFLISFKEENRKERAVNKEGRTLDTIDEVEVYDDT